jgi:tRNA pseudouridine38-40 synthase
MHFDVPETSPFPEGLEAREKFRHSLNGILPEGVAVLRVDAVKADFHALYDVKWKTYEYSLLVRRAKATVDASTHHWIPEFPARFRMDAVLEALKLFEGSHDFVAFAASNHTAQTTVRKIDRAEARLAPVVPGDDENEGLFVVFRFTGKGFLKQMVRTLAGTLVEVGLGKRDVESVKRLLTGRVSRTESGFCAPAHALRLAKVSYDEARET